MECKIRIERQEQNSGIILTNLSDNVTLYWIYSFSSSPFESSSGSLLPGENIRSLFDNKYGMIFRLKDDNEEYCVGCDTSAWSDRAILFFGKEGVFDITKAVSLNKAFSVDITLTTYPPSLG